MITNKQSPWSARAQWVALLALVYLAAPAWGADQTCLTGTDPSVANDVAQIEALESVIETTCPCAGFDGSAGKARRDYLRCVSPLIKAAVKNGDLRSKCKSRVSKAHKLSTCGAASSAGLMPCIEANADGKIRCRIATTAKCQSDGHYIRVACTSFASCNDAGDTNGDRQVAAGDSGTCIVPPTATFTATATATATFTPTPTPTDTSTATPTDTPLPTEPPDFGWTFCADLDQACVLPGNREVRFGYGDVWVSKFISATAVSCSFGVFDPGLEVEFGGEPHCDYFLEGPTRTPTSTGTATPTATPTHTATPEEGWVFCANENGSCTMPSAYRLVRFGIPGHYFVEVGDSTVIDCSVAAFGVDPAPFQAKHCEYSSSDEVLPTFTPTRTFTSTPVPPTATFTATSTPTYTPTRAPEWSFCAHPGETCDLPARDQLVSFGGFPPASPYITSVSDTSVECSAEALFPDHPEIHGMTGDCYYMSWTCDYDSQPVGYLAVNRFGDFPEVRELPRPSLSNLGDCDLNGNEVCEVQNNFSADLDNEIAVFVVDPRICNPDDEAHLSYHWTIRYPPGANNLQAIFAPQGITGYHERILRIAPQSMPTLEGIGGHRRWDFHVEITRQPHPDFPTTSTPTWTDQLYWIGYTDAAASIALATACQAHEAPHPSCPIDQLLHAPEGTY